MMLESFEGWGCCLTIDSAYAEDVETSGILNVSWVRVTPQVL